MATSVGDVAAAVSAAASGVDPRGMELKVEDIAEGEAVRMEEVAEAEGTMAVAAGVAADTTAATRVVEAAADGAEPAASDSTKNKDDAAYLLFNHAIVLFQLNVVNGRLRLYIINQKYLL